jgi:hypothetical protein
MRTVETDGIEPQRALLQQTSEVKAELDFGKLALQNQIQETFDDLIVRESYRSGNLYELYKLRLMLKAGGKLYLRNVYSGDTGPDYILRQEILLNKSGFIDIACSQKDNVIEIEAVRRPVEIQELEYGLKIVEVVEPDEVLNCHEFAGKFYYFKDFNYDLDVARQFDLNADLFVVYDTYGEIYSIARCIVRTPDYYCPFMYATDTEGNHYRVPDEHLRFCEIMALYKEGKKGVIAFKRLAEYLTQYLYYIGHFNSIWITYDDSDKYTGTYYKNKFIMSEVGVKLIYRDFGGLWNLIVSSEIEKGKDMHKELFRR